MLVQIQNLLPMFRFNSKKDTSLTILPVAHVLERMAVYFYIFSAIPIYFGDNPQNLSRMLREVRPSTNYQFIFKNKRNIMSRLNNDVKTNNSYVV